MGEKIDPSNLLRFPDRVGTGLSPSWESYQTIRDRIPFEERVKGIVEGTWSEGVPSWWVDVFSKLLPLESIVFGDNPGITIEEVRERTDMHAKLIKASYTDMDPRIERHLRGVETAIKEGRMRKIQ